MATVRNFEPTAEMVNEDRTPTQRMLGWMRSFSDFIGAGGSTTIPISALGGDGVTTTQYLNEAGSFSTPAYPIGANPTSSIGTSAVNGAASTFMRSDAAPAINLGITPTWTGAHTFTLTTTMAALSATSGTFSTTMQVTGGFGCNGTTPQTSAPVNAAISATAGALYTATEQGMLNDLKSLCNQLRALLIANGQAV